MPEGVTSIGDEVFYNCTSLTSITLPGSLTYIGKEAFAGCSNVTVTTVRGSYAAEYCRANGIEYSYPDSLDWLNG